MINGIMKQNKYLLLILVNTRFHEIYFVFQAEVTPLAVPSDEPIRTRSCTVSTLRSGRLQVCCTFDFSKLSFLGFLGVLGFPKKLGILGVTWDFLGILKKLRFFGFFWNFFGIFWDPRKSGIFLGFCTFARIFLYIICFCAQVLDTSTLCSIHTHIQYI